MYVKEVPELECRHIVPTKAQNYFLSQNLKPFFGKEILKCNRTMKRVSHQIMSTQLYVYISALFHQSFSIVSASGRKLLKMKIAKVF